MLGFSKAWKLAEAKADDSAAWASSRLEFWRHPEMMAQFPFPHTLTMTYRLRDGSVEVETAIENHGTDPMPVGDRASTRTSSCTTCIATSGTYTSRRATTWC